MKQSIDDLFNKKLSDSKAAFNEAHWEDMAKLLDNEKERKPKGFWFILSGFAILSLIGIVVFWTLNNQLDDSSTSTNNSLIKTDQNLKNQTNNSAAKITKIETSKTPSLEDEAYRSTQQNEKTILKSKALSNGIRAKEGRANRKITKITIPSNFTKPASQLNGTIQNNKQSTSIGLPISSQQNFDNQKAVVENISPALVDVSKSSTKIINNNLTSEIDEIQEDLNENLDNVSHDRSFINSPLLNTLSAMLKHDESLFEIPIPTMTLVNKKKVRFGINVYSLNYPYLNSNEQFLIGFGIGPILSFPLNNGLAINTALNYQNRGGNFDVLQSTEQIEYSFGRTVMTSQIQPTSLHYLELPLSIHKRLRKSSIGAGVFASYLFNVRANITKRTEGPNPIVMESFNANVLNDGFTALNFGISASYDRFLTNRLVFEAKLKYHINEITQKDFELVNNYLLKENQQLNLQIGLKYYFNK